MCFVCFFSLLSFGLCLKTLTIDIKRIKIYYGKHNKYLCVPVKLSLICSFLWYVINLDSAHSDKILCFGGNSEISSNSNEAHIELNDINIYMPYLTTLHYLIQVSNAKRYKRRNASTLICKWFLTAPHRNPT